jgi:2-polyprenyl-3-methyl-5-hydroxy-6-metoxy-1,4-benzoquinol methylase
VGIDAAACPACGGAGRRTPLVVHEGPDRYRLLRCPSCRTHFLRPATAHPTWADESRYWERKEFKLDMYESADVQADYDGRYRAVLARVRGGAGPVESVLDVGCGVGNFLSLAGRLGIDAVGVDIDARPVAAARARGLRAFTAAELDRHVPDESVDAATMWDVVEHVIDPGALLADTLRKVRHGGLIIVETPDGRFPLRPVARGLAYASAGTIGLARRLYYWEHKTYFSETGLRVLLEQHGCETLSVERLTSPRAKMEHLLARGARDGALASRAWHRAWPVLESSARLVGRGNKLLVVAQVHR